MLQTCISITSVRSYEDAYRQPFDIVKCFEEREALISDTLRIVDMPENRFQLRQCIGQSRVIGIIDGRMPQHFCRGRYALEGEARKGEHRTREQ